MNKYLLKFYTAVGTDGFSSVLTSLREADYEATYMPIPGKNAGILGVNRRLLDWGYKILFEALDIQCVLPIHGKMARKIKMA
jgi:hypothetical protein